MRFGNCVVIKLTYKKYIKNSKYIYSFKHTCGTGMTAKKIKNKKKKFLFQCFKISFCYTLRTKSSYCYQQEYIMRDNLQQKMWFCMTCHSCFWREHLFVSMGGRKYRLLRCCWHLHCATDPLVCHCSSYIWSKSSFSANYETGYHGN